MTEFDFIDGRRITTSVLKGAFDTAVFNHHLLPPDAQKANVHGANIVVGRHVGTYKGKPDNAFDFLLQNGKMKKTDVTDEEREVLAKSGYDGAVKYGLSLSPDLEYRGFHSCAKATQGCKGSCLAHSAGQNFSGGGGKDVSALLGPRLAQYKRSMAYLNDPGSTAVKLYDEVSKIASAAKKKGLLPVIRMNVTSDVHPAIFSSLIKTFPHVMFDDYTKLNYDPVAANHSVTYSSAGITQPKGVNGAPTDIYNSQSNWKQSRARLEKGHIVAMPFSDKNVLPKSVFDEETGRSYRVVDGDSHDFRFLNQQPPGSPGVIVGLKNKDKGSKQHLAAVTSGGFMTHYDYKTNPTGTIVVPHQERARQKMESDLVSTKEGVPNKFRWAHADHMTKSARAYLQDSLAKVKEDKNKYVADTEAAHRITDAGFTVLRAI